MLQSKIHLSIICILAIALILFLQFKFKWIPGQFKVDFISDERESPHIAKTQKPPHRGASSKTESSSPRSIANEEKPTTLTSNEIARHLSNQVYYQKLCEVDRARMKKLRESKPAESSLDEFHTLVMDTFDTVCHTKVKLGGKYLPHCHVRDGHKYVCMDELMDDMRAGKCLVYSFGLNTDWTFEEALASMGCKVFGFDPTVDAPAEISPNITFKKLGVVGKSTSDDYKTLGELLKGNGHQTTKISYLKMDIEGSEMAGLPVWLKSGALDHVKQLALEIHISSANPVTSTREFFETFKNLQLIGNFRIFNWDPNNCWKNFEKRHDFFHLFEAVFRKIDPSTSCSQ